MPGSQLVSKGWILTDRHCLSSFKERSRLEAGRGGGSTKKTNNLTRVSVCLRTLISNQTNYCSFKFVLRGRKQLTNNLVRQFSFRSENWNRPTEPTTTEFSFTSNNSKCAIIGLVLGPKTQTAKLNPAQPGLVLRPTTQM